MKQKLTISGALIVAGLMSTVAHAADVVVGVPNWPSARATAHVLNLVLENNLGLEVELQNGTNPVIFEAMDTGSMHVHPEVWLPPQASLNDKFVKEKGSVRMNPNAMLGEQGMCVTKGTAERTGIKALSELSDPVMAKNFDTDGDGKGEIWIGGKGWASTTTEKVRARTYGYSETMNLNELDEVVALAEVANAEATNGNIVFMCYTPHYMFALHDLIMLEEPPHNEAKWNVLQPTDDPQWLENSTTEGAWKSLTVHIHYATSLEDTHPEAARLLANVSLNSDIVSAMTYALVVEKQDPVDFAEKWVAENAELVDGWLK